MNARLFVRMTAPIAVTCVLLLALGVGAAWYVHRLQQNFSDILAANVAGIRAAEELELGLLEVRGLLSEFLHTGDRKHLEALPALRRQTGQWLREAERMALTEREQELIIQVEKGYTRFFRELDRLTEQDRSGITLRQSLHTLMQEVLVQEILVPAREYLDVNEQLVGQSCEQNKALTDRVVVGLLLLGTCGAGGGLLAGYGLARGVNRSIVQLSVPIRNATGKLSEVVGPVTLSTDWRFEDLEAVLERMADQVGMVVERLQQSQRAVLHAEQLAAVGQLAAGLAHELRNPLTAIKILVQTIAERERLSGLPVRDLVVLEEEVARLEQSIQAFLDFARPPQPEKRTIDLCRIVEQTTELVSSRAGHQGVRIECSLPQEPVLVEADGEQLRQVLVNLLFNALDAVPYGGTVSIRLQCRSAHTTTTVGGDLSHWVWLEVADTGHGLPPALGERIFEPFVSTKETGTGLGLSICKRIVETHGGEITAANRPGGGAVFNVRLPVLMDLDSLRVHTAVGCNKGC